MATAQLNGVDLYDETADTGPDSRAEDAVGLLEESFPPGALRW
ncbi:hypothetical protein [Desertimonas flava]|nr:hypothetical protein [Desertimonas flava]